MVLKLMAWVAIAFGVIAAVGAAALGAAIPLPFLVLALVCAALLIFTGFSFMRGGTSAPAGLSAAWGFACATTYGFFFSQASGALQRGAFESAQEAQRAYVFGGLALVAAVCFALSLLFGGARGSEGG